MLLKGHSMRYGADMNIFMVAKKQNMKVVLNRVQSELQKAQRHRIVSEAKK